MSFSTDLQAWSSHKALLGLHDFEINLFENIKRVLSNRIKVDLEYAKNLALLTDNAPRIVTTDFSTPLSLVWGNVLHQYHALSELITNNCMKLNEICLPKLENLITEKKYSIKSFVDRRNKSSVILQNHEDEVKRNHTNYEKLLQKFNGIKDKLAQLKKGQNSSKADELWCKLSSTASKVHSTHNEYLLSILECNLFQKHHNSVLLPGLLDLQQNFMESSIRHCQEILSEFFDLTDYTKDNFQGIQEKISELLKSMKPSLEYDDFVATFRSDPLTFVRKEFDPSFVGTSIGRTSESGLYVDEFTCEELQKRELSMVENLMFIKKDLSTKRKELENLEDERSLADGIWDFEMNLKDLKQKIYELQCYEESFASLVSMVSTTIKSFEGSGRSLETFENDHPENPSYQSLPDKHLSKSISSHFLTLFSQNKKSKSLKKQKQSKIFSRTGNEVGLLFVTGYEETNTFRYKPAINRTRSSSLKDKSNGGLPCSPPAMEDMHDRASKLGRRNRSSSESRMPRRGQSWGSAQSSEEVQGNQRATYHRELPAIEHEIESETPLLTDEKENAKGLRIGECEIDTYGLEIEAPSDLQYGSSLGNLGSSVNDSSSNSSSDSLKIRLASKPPPPLPPVKSKKSQEALPTPQDLSLESEDWFHGLLPREEVLHLLQNEGDFLVRATRNKAIYSASSTNPKRQQQFVLSVCSLGGHKHFIIQESEEGFHFEDDSYPTVKEMIDCYLKEGLQVTERTGVVIKTPVRRQNWELRNDDILLQDKIGSGQFGEVYKGVLTIRSSTTADKSHDSRVSSPSSSSLPPMKTPQVSLSSKPAVPPKPSLLASQRKPSASPSSSSSSSSSQMVVAVKICKNSLDDENRACFLKEAKILRLYDHKNIVGFIGVATLSMPVMIVMEFVEGGSLLNFVRNNKELSPLTLLLMSLDVADGMTYLESKNCIHRDLAARNCLVSTKNEESDVACGQQFTIKISDFGMSKIEEEYTITSGKRQIPIKWTAPEALTFGKYTTASDVWSFGILVWELFSFGKVPYQGMSNAVASEMVERGHRLPEMENMPPNLYDLLLQCWHKDPEIRPHFHQILLELQGIKACNKLT